MASSEQKRLFAENVTFAYVTNLSTNTVSTVTSAAFSIHNSSSNYYNGKNDGKKGGGGIYSNHTLCF